MSVSVQFKSSFSMLVIDSSVGYDLVNFGIENLKEGLRIFIISEYQNSPPKLSEDQEHNSDTCSRGTILWFNISLCQTI